MITARGRSDLGFAIAIAFAGILIGVFYYGSLWRLRPDGMAVVSGKLPYWDFSNLWVGGYLVSKGDVAAVFDIELYRSALAHMFSPNLPNQEWSYPPSMLLIGAPLAQVPIGVAYVIWTSGTICALHFALRPLALAPLAHFAMLISPAAFINAVFGQNGALTAAMLIGGLLCVERRPLLSGVLLGALTIKPHLGILVPICLLAGGYHRTFITAAATAIGLFTATGIAFGFDVWALFMNKTVPLMSAILQAPYPQDYQANSITVFIVGRWLGLGLGASYALQGLFMVLSAFAVIWLWLPRNAIDHRKRACLTAALSIVATPYGYGYDTIPMCVAAGFLFLTEVRLNRLFLAIVWMMPLFLHILNDNHIPLGIMAPISLAASALWLTSRDARRNEKPKASAKPPARSGDSCPSAG